MFDIDIIELKSKKDIKKFIKFPWKIYRGEYGQDKNWVPPLIADELDLLSNSQHPLYKHSEIKLFMAYQDSKPVGRIAAIKDQAFIGHKNRSTAFFGFFESINEQEVASALLQKVEACTRAWQLKELIGPISPNPNHILGMLIDSFDRPPIVQTPYNPPYYPDLLEAAAWDTDMLFCAYHIDRELHKPPPKAYRIAEIAKKKANLTIRSLDMKNFTKDIEDIRLIWNAAWTSSTEFVPWDKDEFHYMAKDLRLIANPKLAKIAFIAGEPVGFSIPIPNVNEVLINGNGRLNPLQILRLLRIKRGGAWLRLAILGVKPKFQSLGIEAIMLTDAYDTGLKMGYKHAEMSLINNTNNKLLTLLDKMQFTRYKNYKVYKKYIQE